MKRRNFLLTSLTAPTIITAFPLKNAFGQSPNERIGIGAIGVGGQGSGDTHSAARFGDVVAVADADLRHAVNIKNRSLSRFLFFQKCNKLQQIIRV